MALDEFLCTERPPVGTRVLRSMPFYTNQWWNSNFHVGTVAEALDIHESPVGIVWNEAVYCDVYGAVPVEYAFGRAQDKWATLRPVTAEYIAALEAWYRADWPAHDLRIEDRGTNLVVVEGLSGRFATLAERQGYIHGYTRQGRTSPFVRTVEDRERFDRAYEVGAKEAGYR